MPRTSNAKPVEKAASVENATDAVSVATDENMSDVSATADKKKATPAKTAKAASAAKTAKKNQEPLNDSDEIEVVSLIPSVSYKDSRTLDFYRWDEVGHIEYMTYDTLKNMWRNSKSYFKNMWLKPLDERVIEKFFLTRTYEKYDFLMDAKSYTRDNIDMICETLSSVQNELKFSVATKIKDMIADGQVTDVKVIRALENKLDVDLISLLD